MEKLRVVRVAARIALAIMTAIFGVLATDCGNKKTGEATSVNRSTPQEENTRRVMPIADENAVKRSRSLYMGTCSACHAPDAKGIQGLGPDLTRNQFVKSLTDEELLEFIIKGRPANDPANKTGVEMPPRGGNPALTDDQIRDIIAYLRSLYGR